jgi:hypothetical protein
MENQIHSLIKKAYEAFNSQDIKSAITTFHENIEFQKEFNGNYLKNQNQIIEHWTNGWKEFSVKDKPINIIERTDNKFEVTVHQIVKDKQGKILSDGILKHIFTIQDNLLLRLDIELE